jgi:uncharacterized protein YjdB
MRIALLPAFAALTVVVACSDSTSTAPTPTPSATTPVSVAIDPGALTLVVGHEEAIRVDVGLSSGATLVNQGVIWESSDPTVATVNPAFDVQPLKVGTATLTAFATGADGSKMSGVSAQIVVTVAPPPVAAILVSSAPEALAVGDTLRLIATPIDADGDAIASATVTWSSSDDTVVSVDSAGNLLANQPGLATITATSGGIVAQVTVVVVSSAPNRSLQAGAGRRFGGM